MNEHNPIAQEVNKIQQHWRSKISGQASLRLVRLVIRPEEARVYEGFCKLESSPYGQLDEIFVTHLTPFENEDTFSTAIIRDWLQAYDASTELLKEMEQRGAPLQWDPAPFRQAVSYDGTLSHDATLLKLLASFRQSLPEQPRQLVLALIPRQVSDMRSFTNWLTNMLKRGIPEGVKLLVLDHLQKEQVLINDRPFPGQIISTHVPLQLEQAIQKLATSGSPNDPEVQFRKCLFEMGKALQDKDVKRVHYWGQRALDCTQQSGNKGLFATAHIMYAGMLFNFKRDPQIPLLLEKGMRIAKQGMQQNDPACIPLVIQYYGYHGAYAQLRKNHSEAIDWYVKQATMAQEQHFLPQAMNAWYQAAELSRRKDASRYYTILEQAWKGGNGMTDDEITSSVYCYLASDYYEYAYTNKMSQTVQDIQTLMSRLFGGNWKEEIDKMKKSRARTIMQPLAETETETETETEEASS
ncbi:hypothetical protein [Chitinophaga vietnamensis]|uniref:hypothetical protein n=1 Tax=Chitinophaga vietnamensis TaxID=2593957 RepID=UPI001177482C|nr:hypothetical protein [Chitinophaga vietnamensis]